MKSVKPCLVACSYVVNYLFFLILSFCKNFLLNSGDIESNQGLTKSYPIEDTHWEKAPSNKTPALLKSTNMDILVVGTSNQLFQRGS